MTTDITNLTTRGLVNKSRVRHSSVPEQTVISQSQAARQSDSDNVVRIDSAKRQAVATSNDPQNTVVQSRTSAVSVEQSISDLSRSVQLIERNLEFRIDDNSGRTVITVRDSDSKEVIRQIPSDELLELSARIQDIQQEKANGSSAEAQGILFTSRI